MTKSSQRPPRYFGNPGAAIRVIIETSAPADSSPGRIIETGRLTGRLAMMPFAALALASSLTMVAADGVPTLKVDKSCQAAGVGGLIAGRTTDSCLNDEKSAREDLVKNWSTFSPSDRSHCLSMISTGGDPSYVELLSCLEMSRDAKKIAQGRQLGEQPTQTVPVRRQPTPR